MVLELFLTIRSRLSRERRQILFFFFLCFFLSCGVSTAYTGLSCEFCKKSKLRGCGRSCPITGVVTSGLRHLFFSPVLNIFFFDFFCAQKFGDVELSLFVASDILYKII